MSSELLQVGTLEAAALARKERLAALKASSAPETTTASFKDKKIAGPQLRKPTFRSYAPGAPELQDSVLPEARPAEVTDQVKEEILVGNQSANAVALDELDLMSLAPRKPDWDLKRDVAPKLEKLERRTQRAIAELIRERLKQEDLANAVVAGSSAEARLAAADED